MNAIHSSSFLPAALVLQPPVARDGGTRRQAPGDPPGGRAQRHSSGHSLEGNPWQEHGTKQTQDSMMAARAGLASQRPSLLVRSVGSTALRACQCCVWRCTGPASSTRWSHRSSRSGFPNTDPPGGQAGHHVADQLLHLGYGASLGALSGPRLSSRETRSGLLVLVPALRVARPAWSAGPVENATNIDAHLVLGWAILLVVEEPARQTRWRTRADEQAGGLRAEARNSGR